MLNVEFNGERLREARRYNSKSITQLADDLGVTKQMVSKYENGKAQPGLEAMFSLVNKLKFPREFYYGEDKYSIKSEGTFFRSRLTSTQKDKKPVEYSKKYAAIIRDFLNQYIDFPELDQTLPGSCENPEEYASSVRESWGLLDRPIKDVMRLLEEKGFVVSVVSRSAEKIDAFSSPVTINEKNSYYVIMLKGNDNSFYRQQFSLAHELGHWLMHSEVYNPQELEKDEYKIMEQEANVFAANFLLPENQFRSGLRNIDLYDIESYVELKRVFNVSIGMMLMRARTLGILTDDEYTKLQRQFNYRTWRYNEPLDNITPLSEPIALRQAVELLVENNVILAHEIQKEIMYQYGKALPNHLIEEIVNVDNGYLNYKEPQIVRMSDKRI